MVIFKYKGEQITFPTAYEELSLRQFFAIRDKSKDIFDLFEILSGIPAKRWKAEIDIKAFDSMMPFLEFIKEEPPAFDSFLMPDTIEIKGKRYGIPEGLGLKTLAQKMCFEDAIEKSQSDVDLIPTALAIYFHPDIDDCDFDEDRLKHTIELVLDCKVNEAFPIAYFFFKNYSQYVIKREKNYHTNQLPKNSPLELIDLKSSGNMERFGFWRRLSIRILRACFGWIITPALSNSFTKGMKRATKKRIKKS